ncbi:MAG: HlyD family type I secretion periplasmic adaptor subunit [Rhizobiaceae bacterium]
MSESLGKIATTKIPASQAIPGNAEHAKIIANATKGNARTKPNADNWAKNVRVGVFWPALIGLIILGMFIVGFGFWAARAPLSGAAIAPGIITASGQNLHLQHFEGGIIEKILVVEGENVTQGQALLSLDPTDAQATRNRLAKSLVGLRARDERLQAERDGVAMKFSNELKKQAAAAGLEADLVQQQREFDKRSQRYSTDAKIVDQQVTALQEQIGGFEVQRNSTKDQLKVLDQEIKIKARLVKRKLTPISILLKLRRNRSELEGRLGGYLASIGQARSSIARAKEEKLRLLVQREETAVTQLNEGRARAAEMKELIRSAENVLKRVVVRSPAEGIVINITKNTPGSVVRQGEDLFVILPLGGELIVEARVSVQDVDVVSVGQTASLRFSALNSRVTPEVPGVVSYISADRQLDPVTNEAFYTARLKIAEVLPETIQREQILPGMPVETYIRTGDRTFLEYLMKPLLDSFNRAFREG